MLVSCRSRTSSISCGGGGGGGGGHGAAVAAAAAANRRRHGCLTFTPSWLDRAGMLGRGHLKPECIAEMRS